VQILVAMALFGGISGWALAVFPLLRSLHTWSSDEVLLSMMVLLGTLPFLVLVPFGGGIAARYLIFGLPCMFVLAAMHWETIDRALPSWGYRTGLAVAVLAFNLPYLASIASDGDHFDYRGIARELDSMEIQNPIVLVSSHRMFAIYFDSSAELVEMTTFQGGVPRTLIDETIQRAHAEQRPLVLVSKEDRTAISPADQAWLFSRFALIRYLQSSRFDHRQFRMAIYQYRPQSDALAAYVEPRDPDECAAP
jgi:hypothetical protein